MLVLGAEWAVGLRTKSQFIPNQALKSVPILGSLSTTVKSVKALRSAFTFPLKTLGCMTTYGLFTSESLRSASAGPGCMSAVCTVTLAPDGRRHVMWV